MLYGLRVFVYQNQKFIYKNVARVLVYKIGAFVYKNPMIAYYVFFWKCEKIHLVAISIKTKK